MNTYSSIKEYFSNILNSAIAEKGLDMSINPDLQKIYDTSNNAIINQSYAIQKQIEATIFEPSTYGVRRGVIPYIPVKSSGNVVLNADSAGIIISSSDNILFSNNSDLYEVESGRTAQSVTNEYTITSISRNSSGLVAIQISGYATSTTIGTLITITGVAPSSFNGDFSIVDFGNSDASIIYVQADDLTVEMASAGTFTATTIAVPVIPQGIGLATNRDIGSAFQMESPITGISEIGYVGIGGLAGGRDAETQSEYSKRVEDTIKSITTLINASYYEGVARELSGVTRAWFLQTEDEYSSLSYKMYHMRDNNPDPYPTTGQNLELKTYFTSISDSNDTKFHIGINPELVDFRTPGELLYIITFTYLPLSLQTSDVMNAIKSDITNLFKELQDGSDNSIPSNTAITNTALQTLQRIDKTLQIGTTLDDISSGLSVSYTGSTSEDITIASLEEIIFP